ncbi:MAG: hypothetical protein IKQ92_10435 [Clostridia bacterium]|nr:hypothetical protein [Clostridia bacterium]
MTLTKPKRLSAFLLALLMLMLPLAGCGESSANADPEETEPTQGVGTEPADDAPETEEKLVCSVPGDLKMSGESVRFLHFRDVQTFTVDVEELSGELLNDAVFNSNQKVMEDLDCVFRHIENDGIEADKVTNAYRAGDDIYEIVYGTQWKVAPLTLQHMLANLNGREGYYFDYEKPWWYRNYIGEAMADSGHTYFLAGDASPDVFRRSSMMILNTDLLTDIGRDVSDIYELVLNGDWTFDRLSEIVGGVYVDVGGNGERDERDTYGYATSATITVDHFMIDCGVRGCSRDEEGVPYLDFNTPDTIRFVELLYDLLWNNNGSFGYQIFEPVDMLEGSRVLFLNENFSRLDLYRNVETNFTILPLPKLDDTVESYGSLTHDDANILCIPAISGHIASSSAVLEKMGYCYYYEVMPDYYDVILKTKYRRDSSDAASQIIDLIHDSMTTDFGYFYNYSLGNMMLSLRSMILIDKSKDFVSTYKRSEKIYERMLSNLLEAVREDN